MKRVTQKRGPSLAGKRVVVLGAGRSGVSASRLALAAGARVRLLERSASVLGAKMSEELQAAGIELGIGEHTEDHFSGAQLVILSPGIPTRTIQQLLSLQTEVPFCSELELASWFVSEPIIAVTGTNGKTTTVGLISQIFKSQGREVFLGGNIGTPLSEYVLSKGQADLLVLEVSSFQLQNTRSFRPRVSVFLNFSLNHLDYHQDHMEYWEAKTRVFQSQGQADTAILPSAWQEDTIVHLGDQVQKRYFSGEKGFRCPGLLGPHNQANVEAACLACGCFGIPREQALVGIKNYQGPPHRLQLVREVDGVRFVNDSKATTIEAQEAALKSFQRPVLLLAGGRYKGGRPEGLAELVAEKVKVLGLFGESRELFAKAWADTVPLFWEPSLEKAFQRIVPLAAPGDVVLLAPGTSSFDLFADYEQRGLAFMELVAGIDKHKRGDR